jgi:transposase
MLLISGASFCRSRRRRALGDVEIIARVERRRRWTSEEKVALLAEVEAEGGRVSAVARRHRISDSLLYNWRSAFKAAASIASRETLEFVPVGIIGEHEGTIAKAATSSTIRRGTDTTGRIEIELPGGARVRVDMSVSAAALSRVLRVLKDTT